MGEAVMARTDVRTLALQTWCKAAVRYVATVLHVVCCACTSNVECYNGSHCVRASSLWR